MPTIKPVSDLRNYNEVLKEVDSSGMVYLTRNGSGACSIMFIEEADDDRSKALHDLLSDLERAKQRAEREGWIEEDNQFYRE